MASQTSRPLHFIGYTSLEEWACHTERQQPVFVALTEQASTGAAIEQRQVCVLVQQLTPQGDVRYCRLPIGWQTYSRGQPFEPREHAARQERYAHACRLIKEWLRTASGYSALHDATVAPSADLQLLDGTAGFLLFDPEHKRFYCK